MSMKMIKSNQVYIAFLNMYYSRIIIEFSIQSQEKSLSKKTKKSKVVKAVDVYSKQYPGPKRKPPQVDFQPS